LSLSLLFDHFSMILGYSLLGLVLIGGLMFGVQYLRYRKKFNNFKQCIGTRYLYLTELIGVFFCAISVIIAIGFLTKNIPELNAIFFNSYYLIYISMIMAILGAFLGNHFLKINNLRAL
jgi:hypothetical protein